MEATRPRARLARAAALVLVAAFVLGVLLWLLRVGAGGPDVAAPPPLLAAAVGPPAPEAPALPPPGDGRLPEAVERYLAATVYPPTSGRLGPEAEDLLQPNRRYERARIIPESLGADPEVLWLLTADRYFYTGDETAHVWLEVRSGSAPAPVAIRSAQARAEGRAGPVGRPVALRFAPEGERLEADLDLARAFPEHHGPVLVSVRFDWGGGSDHEDAIRLFSTPPARIPARFTGTVRDFVRGGNLVLEVGVEVSEAGFYRVDGNLYDAAGAPVAWVTFKGELATRDGFVPLEVFGKVLRDAGARGPFSLGELRGYRFLDGSFPDREPMRPLAGRLPTSDWPLEAFSDAVYTSAHKEQMVRLLLEDAAAGRRLFVPPLAVEGERAREPELP